MHLITKAPAKVNLRLKVEARSSNNYHLLSMLNISIDFADTLELQLSSSNQLELEVYHNGEIVKGADLASVDKNLATRAIIACCRELGEDPNFLLKIHKSIPLGSGLAGGSSNAAAALRLLQSFYSDRKLVTTKFDSIAHRLGLSLGADIPFAMFGSPAIVQGIGDEIREVNLSALKGIPIYLFLPPFLCETAKVFSQFAETTSFDRDGVLDSDLRELGGEVIPYQRILGLMENDLEMATASCYPGIRDVAIGLRQLSFVKVVQSGSGSSFVAIPVGAGSLDVSQEQELFDTAERLSVVMIKTKLLCRLPEVERSSL